MVKSDLSYKSYHSKVLNVVTVYYFGVVVDYFITLNYWLVYVDVHYDFLPIKMHFISEANVDSESGEDCKTLVSVNSLSSINASVCHLSFNAPVHHFWSSGYFMGVGIYYVHFYDGNVIDLCSIAIYRMANDEQMAP